MIVISHVSALEAYRRKRPLAHVFRHLRAGDIDALPDEIELPSASRAEVLAQTYGLTLPLHVLAPHDGARRRTATVFAHTWTSRIPTGSLLYLEDGVYLSTPAFLFQQLCPRSDFENRLLLGSELVGGYAISPDGSRGLLSRPALTTSDELRGYLRETENAPGAKEARKTARFLLDGARSPKEAEIAALYTLPRRMGGRQIPGIAMDRRLDLTPEASRIARRSYLVFDHYLSIEGRDHEYDSDDHHLMRQEHESDVRRGNALKLMGVKLTIMTNGQLHDWETFDSIASHLATDNEAVFRNRPASIVEAQQRLWERLLFGKRRNGKTILDGTRNGRSSDPITNR